MINKEKLIRELEDRINNHEYYINVNHLLTDLKNGYYDARGYHDVAEFYKE